MTCNRSNYINDVFGYVLSDQGKHSSTKKKTKLTTKIYCKVPPPPPTKKKKKKKKTSKDFLCICSFSDHTVHVLSMVSTCANRMRLKLGAHHRFFFFFFFFFFLTISTSKYYMLHICTLFSTFFRRCFPFDWTLIRMHVILPDIFMLYVIQNL